MTAHVEDWVPTPPVIPNSEPPPYADYWEAFWAYFDAREAEKTHGTQQVLVSDELEASPRTRRETSFEAQSCAESVNPSASSVEREDLGPAPVADEVPSPQLPSVLTADELAALLRVNRKTVYASFRAGEIPGGRRIGATIRFSRDAVLHWLAEGHTTRPSRGAR